MDFVISVCGVVVLGIALLAVCCLEYHRLVVEERKEEWEQKRAERRQNTSNA